MFSNSLSYYSRVQLNFLRSKCIQSDTRILKHAITTSTRRTKVAEQLYFIRACIQKKLITTNIYSTTKKLPITHHQRGKLQETIMKNYRANLYKKLSEAEKTKSDAYYEVKAELRPHHLLKLDTIISNECVFTTRECRKHYQRRLDWLIKKKRQSSSIKDELENFESTKTDDVRFTDCDISHFESNPRIYGGITLNSDESAALQLPPKFAVYNKINPLIAKSQIEKAFTKLRWKKEIPSDDEDEDPREFYNQEDNTFNLERIRATDLPFNKTVRMPPYADEDTEAKIDFAKSELYKIVGKYHEEEKQHHHNVDRNVKQGIASLKSRTKENSIVCYPTDKSGRMTVDNPDNYKKAMEPHLSATKVAQSDYDKTEKLLNAHMTSWCNILSSDDRVRNNFIAVNNQVPPLYGLRKDHKAYENSCEGPPTRPVCGANVASSKRISHFLSMILRPYIKSAPTTCESTEDLLSRIHDANARQNLDKAIIGSMDVKALYPSIDVDFAVDKCMEIVQDSNTEFENVDTDELGLFISLTVTEIPDDIKNLCPTRSKAKGKPTITGTGMERNDETRWSSWNKCCLKPTSPHELRKMVAFGLGITLRAVLKNHIYEFDGNYYLQTGGGAIGVAVAGDIAVLFMCWWDQELLRRIRQEEMLIHFYGRYVDDINTLIDAGIMEGNADRNTMEKLQNVANTIHPSIQVTIDYPSIHTNKRLPVLDLEMWMDTVKQQNGNTKHQVLHSHYMKPMASKHVINKQSALPDNIKENILVTDLVRIQRNISQNCPSEERTKHIQHFLDRMQFSGYSALERAKTYKKANKRFNTMLERDRLGTTPLYRHKEWNRVARDKEKWKKQRSWFRGKRKQYETTLFIDATPHSALAKDLQKTLNKAGLPIRVIEKAGTSIKQLLSRSNPFRSETCSDASCAVCSRANKVTNCKTRECLYELKCECGESYIGETSRSAKERISEHFASMTSQSGDSVLKRHMNSQHGGIQKAVKVEVLATYPDDAMGRQVAESIYINTLKPHINAKEEWGNKNQPRRRNPPQQQLLNSIIQY